MVIETAATEVVDEAVGEAATVVWATALWVDEDDEPPRSEPPGELPKDEQGQRRKRREREGERTLTSLGPVLPVTTLLTPHHPTVLAHRTTTGVLMLVRTSFNNVGFFRSQGATSTT